MTDKATDSELLEDLMSRCTNQNYHVSFLHRSIFASGNFPEAEILYDKAIKVKPDAVLYANRAAVRLGLNLADSALADATKAIELDAEYSKAYYRKGQAHNVRKEFEAAFQAFERGIELDPSNKTFRECASAAKEAAAKARAVQSLSADESSQKPGQSISDSTKSKGPSNSMSPVSAPPPSKKAASKSAGERMVDGDEDQKDERNSRSENMRGYKVLEDGRKTTYFNNVLSEDAKRLIGDIAPKKIEAPVGTGNRGTEGTTGSAWNYAGTFEERNMTDWAKGRLQELLGECRFPIPARHFGAGLEEGAVIEVKKVTGLEGDAAVTFVRGKKKYLYDFLFTLEWEAGLAGGAKAKGTLRYPDVTPDNDDEYDTLLEVDQLTPPEARSLIDEFVKSSRTGLQGVVREKLRLFMADFQAF